MAVLGDGLKYEGMTVNAAESQLTEQLNLTGIQICLCYHVPPELLDLRPAGADLESLLQKYHSQCIQSLLINFETKLDEGLELRPNLGTEFDIDDLIWMVTATKVKAAADSIGAGALSPDEARQEVLRPRHRRGRRYAVHAAAEFQPRRAGRTRRRRAVQ